MNLSNHRPVAFALLFGSLTIAAGGSDRASQPTSPAKTVRLALVRVPEDVLAPMLPKFLAETGITASIVYAGRDPFSVAREGKADLAISHYGHEGVEEFVLGGFGLWPKAVFSNQVALLGPAADPANVRGLTDPVEAFRRMAQTKSRYITNSSPGIKYLEDIITTQLGAARLNVEKTEPVEGPEAARTAAKLNGYVLWGLPPFLRLKQQKELQGLEPLMSGASLFQRVMVATIVNPAKAPAAQKALAQAFVEFLLKPQTQAAVEAFRYPNFPHQAWFSAGRQNNARE